MANGVSPVFKSFSAKIVSAFLFAPTDVLRLQTISFPVIWYSQYLRRVGRYNSVGIVTRYTLGGHGIESRWVRGFPHPSRLALRSTQPASDGQTTARLEVLSGPRQILK